MMATSANHKQVKVLIDAEIADAFKEACAKAGMSMAGELARFMAEYGATAKKRKPAAKFDVSTRRKRRKWVDATISQMEQVMGAETRYYENIPENLQASAAHESSAESISVMEEVLELLEAIYE
jgi:hypothetical protein